MKYTITHIAEWVLLAILALLCIYTAYKAYTIKDRIEYITTTDTITITDTITNWQPQYIKEYRTDTAYLPVIEERLDTVTQIDTVLVEIPIKLYHYDTTIADTTHTTRIQADISGFNVSLEQLTATTEIMPQTAKKWYSNIVPAVGIGIGTGGVGAFVGVGYKIF